MSRSVPATALAALAFLGVLDAELTGQVLPGPLASVRSAGVSLDRRPMRVDELPLGTLLHGTTHRHDAAHPDDVEPESCCSHDGWVARPDAHGPLGVPYNHMHREGEWMIGLMQMDMHMDGLRDGTSRISSADTFAKGFMVAPIEMDMEMTMVHGMYGVTDDFTVMVMAPWIETTMDHETGTGVKFTTESEGLGDVQLGGMFRVHEGEDSHAHLSLGLSLPTGSIHEKDETPASGGADVQLPYPMQLGTGTYDLLPGVTYTARNAHWSWGGRAQVRFHLGENDHDWTRGTAADVSGWVARKLDDTASVSLRVNHSITNDIRGADPRLNPNVVPTADPSLAGGERTDVFLGLNLQATQGSWAGHRFALEFGVPVYQRLHGPQLETDRIVTFGWQKGF